MGQRYRGRKEELTDKERCKRRERRKIEEVNTEGQQKQQKEDTRQGAELWKVRRRRGIRIAWELLRNKERKV
jgi:hypothetical protein